MDAAKRIEQLRDLLRSANRAYYADASPTMSDREFDERLAELARLEADHPQLDDPTSPTRRVGGQPIAGFESFEHAVPMLSIANTYDAGEVRAWVERVNKALAPTTPDEPPSQVGGLFDTPTRPRSTGVPPVSPSSTPPLFTCDPKIDGVALSLRYENATLAQALTRGDGTRGDDVTHIARAIRAIPLKLQHAHDAQYEPRVEASGPGNKQAKKTARPRSRLVSESSSPITIPDILEIRGEVFIPNSEFARINKQRIAAGDDPFMNPRNACAGTIKKLDPKAAADRRLGFIAHGRGEISDDDFARTHTEFCARIHALGVPTSPHQTTAQNADEILTEIAAFDAKRTKLDHATDGMVIRVDSFDQQDTMGTTSKSPRWCIAYKYPAQRKTTRLLDVLHQVGKTGKITPRAVLEPVLLAGTTVRHATLHNYGRVRHAQVFRAAKQAENKHTDIRLGDRVYVEKAGEIIPQIVGVELPDRPKRARKVVAPDTCPVCAGPVEIEPPEAGTTPTLETSRRCVNPECPAQVREKLVWFAGRNQMDIDGLGESTIDLIRATSQTETKEEPHPPTATPPDRGPEGTLLQNEDESARRADPPIPLDHFADIFKLHQHRDALLELDRMGEKKADNLLAGIERAKSRGLARVLAGMGIRHVGTSTSKALARVFADLDALLGAEVWQLMPMAVNRMSAKKRHTLTGSPDKLEPEYETGLGEDTAPIFFAYLHSDAARHAFDALRAVGVDLTSRDYDTGNAEQPESFFRNTTIVLTGTLESFTRPALKEILESLGAKVTGSVSAKTDLLIAGEQPGSKLHKAQTLGVETWNEQRLIKELPPNLRPKG